VQLGGDMVGTESYDNFCYSISLSASGMQVAVGSPRSNSMSGGIPHRGSISIYEFDGSMWKRQQGRIGGLHDFENVGHSCRCLEVVWQAGLRMPVSMASTTTLAWRVSINLLGHNREYNVICTNTGTNIWIEWVYWRRDNKSLVFW
jgi:hypothetical protein